MPLPDVVSLRPGYLTVELDRDIGKYMEQMADFFLPRIQRDVIRTVVSAILYSLIGNDSSEAFDAFERIIARCDLHTEWVRIGDREVRKEELAWTHFMQLNNLFMHRYQGQTEFKEDLSNLLSTDERGPCEELFLVYVSRDWRFMKIQ